MINSKQADFIELIAERVNLKRKGLFGEKY